MSSPDAADSAHRAADSDSDSAAADPTADSASAAAGSADAAASDTVADLATAATSRAFLRHTLATLAYRGGKAIQGTPADFESFTPHPGVKPAGSILAHICDLMDWGLSIARGEQAWRDTVTDRWEDAVERFFRAVAAFDAYLASDAPLHASPESLFQGPIADAHTHVGQIATYRRAAGAGVKGENYFVAEITAGRVGRDQSTPRREFD